MYFLTKDLVGNLESFSEIGFKLLGRSSIFMINALVFFNCAGCLIVYYNIFSGIMASIFFKAFGNPDSLLSKEWFHLLWYFVINLMIIFKRTIKELNIIGTLHYLAAKLFIITVLIKLMVHGTVDNHDTTFNYY